MVRRWREGGWDVVEAVKSHRGRESAIHRLTTRAFYRAAAWLTGYDLQDASDFKLLDRRVLDQWRRLGERATFFRGLVAWLGFRARRCLRRAAAPERRFAMVARALTGLAIHAVTSFSAVPLQLVTVLGLVMLLVAVGIGAQALRLWWEGLALPGFTTVILLQLIIGGFLMVSLGIIGTYIARIYDEVKGRPRYVVRDTAGVIAHERGRGPAAARRRCRRHRGDYQARALESPWAAQRFWHAAKIRLLDRVRRRSPVRAVADAGCGSGVIADHLARTAREVVGFDSNPAAVEFARGVSAAEPALRAGPVRAHRRRRPVRPDRLPRGARAPLSGAGAGHAGAVRARGSAGRPLFMTTPNARSAWPAIEWLLDRSGLVPTVGRGAAPDVVHAGAAPDAAASRPAGRWRSLGPSMAWRRSSRRSANRWPSAPRASNSPAGRGSRRTCCTAGRGVRRSAALAVCYNRKFVPE